MGVREPASSCGILLWRKSLAIPGKAEQCIGLYGLRADSISVGTCRRISSRSPLAGRRRFTSMPKVATTCTVGKHRAAIIPFELSTGLLAGRFRVDASTVQISVFFGSRSLDHSARGNLHVSTGHETPVPFSPQYPSGLRRTISNLTC